MINQVFFNMNEQFSIKVDKKHSNNNNNTKTGITLIELMNKIEFIEILYRETFNGEVEVAGCAPGRVNLIGLFYPHLN